ncbi:MAG: hypothetical protein WAV07_13640, partial [Candidatus Contendobacter sp.]
MSRRNPFVGFSRVVLIGALALFGCTSGNSLEPGKGSATSTPSSHKQVGKASWYGPGLQGEETANGEAFDQKKLWRQTQLDESCLECGQVGFGLLTETQLEHPRLPEFAELPT